MYVDFKIPIPMVIIDKLVWGTTSRDELFNNAFKGSRQMKKTEIVWVPPPSLVRFGQITILFEKTGNHLRV